MKILPVSLVVLSLATACTAFSQEHVVLYDGLSNIASDERATREATEVERSPVFDNAPFLRLRKGDKLIKAKEVHMTKPFKGPDRLDYYLYSGGKYYRLDTDEENGKLNAHLLECCMLFDWDLTMPNATALRGLFSRDNDGYSRSLTIRQYDAIIAAVGPQFPEVTFRSEYEVAPELKADRIVSVPGTSFAEFHGLAYDEYQDAIYRYWIRIGPAVCSITGEVLARGPRYVHREEFEGYHSDGKYPNAAQNYDVDPKVAKVKKAEYDRMEKFQGLVNGAIRSGTLTP